MKEFVHLHNHSDYSLLDATCTVENLIQAAAENGMKAVALTDHGNLFGALKLYNYARKTNIKPIIGCEVYVAPGSRFDKKRSGTNGTKPYYHLILIAQNEIGYRNLMKLSSLGYLEGFYYKPRVDKELLKTHSDGLIALSSCINGEVPSKLLRGDINGAKNAAVEYIEIFDGRYYLEL
ncbi:MAG: PHP domain-containing protein, partial [Fidelibacterota bacterium]